MKQFIFLLLASLVACISAMAQNNHPLVEEGKVWYFKGFALNIHDDSYKVWDETYSLEGDTVIGSHQCLKLYITCNSSYKTYDHAYIGAMYEKRGKVYYIVPGNTTSTLLYDFSCDVGDIVKMDLYDIYRPTVAKWDEYELVINDKQLVKYRDEYLTVMNWSPLYDDEVVDHCTIWIESIGSPDDLLNSAPQWGANGISKELIECKLNDQIIYSTYDFGEYYPEPKKRCFIKGSKWTEIRLDTLKYDNWYSKIGNEWVPNYETVEYYVKPRSFYYQGHTCNEYVYLYNVYTNGSNWTDSLSFVLYEYHTEDDICIKAYSHYSEAQAYQFNWFVGKKLYYQNIVPFISSAKYPYGTIEEIKGGDFGGIRPLKYVDLNGIRIIQGIGVTEWDDGECLFGPVNLYRYSSSQGTPPERHYRSMLVHFERGDEVLYDVWPEKETTAETVTFTQDQMATIILPTAPDASKGKYYRLDRCEDGKIIFEEEKQPQARTPYIIVPNEDFSIDPSTLDLAGLSPDTVSIEGISFIGSYKSEEVKEREGWYIDIIDTTPDCQAEEGKIYSIGALRAYLTVNWDDPYQPDGTKGPREKMEIVLNDKGTSLNEIKNEKLKMKNGESIYDLSGRRFSGKTDRGIYIEDGKKVLLK